MNAKEAKNQRLMLISSWKNNNGSRKSISRDQSSTTAELPPKKNARRNSKTRECLIPIANEPAVVIQAAKQPSTFADEKNAASIQGNKEDKENQQKDVQIFTKLEPIIKQEATNNNVDEESASVPLPESSASLENAEPEQTEVQLPSVVDSLLNLPFAIGDLVWAYISGYPLWPSLITPDPLHSLYTKIKVIGRATETRLFHVEFFGDNGSRSWLPTAVLFPFKGSVEELLCDKEGFMTKHVQTKSKIFKSLQNAIKSGRKNWHLAIEEARESLQKSKEERLASFRSLLLSKEEESIQRKRKTNSIDPSDRKAKRQRQSKENGSEGVGSSEDLPPPPPTPSSTTYNAAEPEEDADSAGNSLKEESEEINKEVAIQIKRDKEKKALEMRIEVCECCGSRQGRIIPCVKCRSTYHSECLKDVYQLDSGEAESLICPNCHPLTRSRCCLCQQSDGETLNCTFKLCGRRYHRHCLKMFHSPSVKHDRSSGQQFTCPAHYCHTCVADVNELFQPDRKLIRCIECPTSYHPSDKCLAAGCVQLSNFQMKCFKHVENRGQSKKRPKKEKKTLVPTHYNVAWCVICSIGGSLICCERCPSSFHTRCIGMDQEPDGSFLCLECTCGKTVLHGDIVWVKMGIYRWWPGRILPLDEIPAIHQKYQPKAGEFLVYFYGSNNTAFVYRGQVFLYQDGDQGCKGHSKNKLGDDFKLAVEDVTPAFENRKKILAENTAERRSRLNVKPPPYQKLRINKPIGKVRINDYKPSSASRCECKINSNQQFCGSDSECLNRILLIECDSNVCSGGESCQNRRFQLRSSPPLYPFNTGGKGWGLKCQADIRKGDFVVEYVGEIIDNNEFRRRLKAKQDAQDEAYYFLTLDNHRMIDAGPGGNLARFMNHSCQPNCETQKWTVLGDTRIGLFAVADIPAHTELTFNYQLECAQDVANESNQRQQQCHCGAANCAGFIGAKPKQLKVENAAKGKKEKKKKRQRKIEKETVAEDFCFRCTEGGRLVMCDSKNCSKVYHVECLNLAVPPKGQWTCPWHHCDVCGRKSSQFCSVCPNSLCSNHALHVDMQSHPQLGTMCNEHSPEEIDFYVKHRMEIASLAVMSTSPEPSSTSLSETSSC